MRRTIAIISIVCVGFISLAQAADVTVQKGTAIDTVMAGLAAAGPGGTVTIADSETYVEDVLIMWPMNSGVTIQAAAGQRPTIAAANVEDRWTFLPVSLGQDRIGLLVSADCTLIGLTITNTDPTLNPLGVATCMVIQGIDADPAVRCTMRDCHVVGPGVDAGDFAGVGIMSWSTTATAEAIFENCEFYDAPFGVVPTNFSIPLAPYGIPFAQDISTTLTDCYIHDCFSAGYQSDAGLGVLIDCDISSNSEAGVSVGGGETRLIRCNIQNNLDEGVGLDWDEDFNAGRTNYPNVTMTECLVVGNGSGEANVDARHGWLTIDRSVLSQGDGGGILMRNDAPADIVLNMNFCDIYQPLRTCVRFQDAGANRAWVYIRNSILVGDEGVICNPAHTASVSFTDIWARVTAVQDTATSNNVSIDPVYRMPNFPQRDPATNKIPAFQYFNDNLNVGEGTAWIGSQGQYIPDKPLRGRSWFRYE